MFSGLLKIILQQRVDYVTSEAWEECLKLKLSLKDRKSLKASLGKKKFNVKRP